MGKVMMSGVSKGAAMKTTGIHAYEIAIGSSVYLMENGEAAEYLVVSRSIPGGSSLYDSSCDGIWLLRKDIYESRQWHSENVNDYENSDIHAYLNGTFLGLFDNDLQSAIKEVILPYRKGAGKTSDGATTVTGSSGLPTKIFLLSGYEVGFTSSTNTYFPVEGAKLDYFVSGDSSSDSSRTKRIAYLNGTATDWWLRSPRTYNKLTAWAARASGSYTSENCSSTCGVRPALVLPLNTLFDEETLLFKGVG